MTISNDINTRKKQRLLCKYIQKCFEGVKLYAINPWKNKGFYENTYRNVERVSSYMPSTHEKIKASMKIHTEMLRGCQVICQQI